MSGTGEMLSEGRADIVIGADQAGVVGALLMPIRFIPVASPSHPLHQLGRSLTERDLRRHRRIFIRDTGSQRKTEVAGVELRWTVSNKATAIRAIVMGLGFAWVPEETILPELADGTLKPLPMAGAVRVAQLYLAHSDPEFPGRDAARLAQIIQARVSTLCAKDAKQYSKGSAKAAARSDAFALTAPEYTVARSKPCGSGATTFTPGVARISVACVQPIGWPPASAIAFIEVAPSGYVWRRAATCWLMPSFSSTLVKWTPAVAFAGSGM